MKKKKKLFLIKLFSLFALVLGSLGFFIFNSKVYAYGGNDQELHNNNITNFENLIMPSDSVYNYVFNNNDIIIAKKNNSSFNNFSGNFTFNYSSNVSVNSSLDTYIYFIAFTHKGVDLNFEFSNENESLFDYYYIENQTANLQYDCYLWRLNADNNLYFNTLDISFDCSSTYNKNILYLYLNTIQFVGLEYPNSAWINNMFNPFDSSNTFLNSDSVDATEIEIATYQQLAQQYQQQLLDYEGTIQSQQQTISDLQTQVTNLERSLRFSQQAVENLQQDYDELQENNLTWEKMFFTMADTPLKVVGNVLGQGRGAYFFGINLFDAFIGIVVALGFIWLLKKFI